MTQVTLQLDSHLADQLKVLAKFLGDDNKLVDNILDYHRKKIRRTIAKLKADLKEYEEKYSLTSEVFYQNFKAGNTDDSEDTILWAGVYEFLIESEEKLKQLK